MQYHIMKPKTFLVPLLLCCLHVQAQQPKLAKPEYKTAIGIKFFPAAASIKTFSGKKAAWEFLGYFNDGFRLTILSEYHGKLNSDGHLKWYIGGGGHAGFSNKASGGSAKIGIDGVIGLDYKFLHLPLNLSLDWQPSFGFGDESSFTGDWGGIAVRYCF